MKRAFLIVMLALMFVLLISGYALAKGADVTNIVGPGALIAQQWLEESDWDWHYGIEVYPSTKVTITPVHEPFWSSDYPTWFSLEQKDYSDEIAFTYQDELNNAVGVAYYPSGDVYIDSKLLDGRVPFFREVVSHELAHSRVWFVWMAEDSEAIGSWEEIVTRGILPGLVNSSWYYMPAEAHAEWHRLSYNDKASMSNQFARTSLSSPGGKTGTIDFHNYWCYGTGLPPSGGTGPGSLSVTINDNSPYRVAYDLYDEFELSGAYTGNGTVWFRPKNWPGGNNMPYEARMNSDGTWIIYIPAMGFTGPEYIDFEIINIWNSDNYVAEEYSAWFDITAPAFWDVPSSDFELYCATHYMKDTGLSIGYPDGSFGPWNLLLKRHVALITSRAGIPSPDWFNDYTPALRGEVRDAFPMLTWKEERWDETILRSQLARLIFRDYWEN